VNTNSYNYLSDGTVILKNNIIATSDRDNSVCRSIIGYRELKRDWGTLSSEESLDTLLTE
jgi:hypothetical protein